MPYLEESYDIVVVGAGHAGCEAALACARLGLETIVFTVSVDSIALMPCNPNIGGSSKGHLVRELDALGGEMGKNIDKTFIQSKMLNESKGPAVHSLRAQADKQDYSRQMRHTMENTDHLTIRQAEVSEIIVEDHKITGVKTYSGAVYHAKAVVLATGTYLKARCIYGDVSNATGPNGLQPANHLTDSLIANGIEMFRFKTGTPARADRRSIDFSKMEEQFGIANDIKVSVLSRMPEVLTMEEVPDDEDSMWKILSEVVEEAADSFVESRVREGEHLKNDLLGKLDYMLEQVAFIEERSPRVVAEYRMKLEEKVHELLESASIDEGRIATEVTIFADKICVDEETVRLRSHIEHTRKELLAGGSVGRKLDFIAQEMNREANTILSKANDLEISEHAIILKTEIEKVREQIQNIE